MPYCEQTKQGIRLKIRLSPKAKREGFEGIIADAGGDERIKVAVNAPPVDGKANKALIAFLSKKWHLPKSAFDIVSGLTDRNKTLLIKDDGDLINRIQQELHSCLKSSKDI